MSELLTEEVRKEIRRLCSIPVDDLTNSECLMRIKYLDWYPDDVMAIIEEIKNEPKKSSNKSS